jgi:hypothetical protein
VVVVATPDTVVVTVLVLESVSRVPRGQNTDLTYTISMSPSILVHGPGMAVGGMMVMGGAVGQPIWGAGSRAARVTSGALYAEKVVAVLKQVINVGVKIVVEVRVMETCNCMRLYQDPVEIKNTYRWRRRDSDSSGGLGHDQL